MKPRRIDWYPDDWLAGTMSLDMVERGVYSTAVNAMYSHSGKVLKAELRRLCPMHGNAYKRAIESLIRLGKLTEKGEYFTNKRVEIEWKKAVKRVASALENGRTGGRPPRKTNTYKKPEVSETGKLTRVSPSPSPSPSPSKPKRVLKGGVQSRVFSPGAQNASCTDPGPEPPLSPYEQELLRQLKNGELH